MNWNRQKRFMLGFIALCWMMPAGAQQLRTDTLFLQSRESAKLRLRLEQERALRKQTPNPNRVAAFLEEQSIKADRLEFDAAQDAFKSQEAFSKNNQNWQTYLTEKSQEQSRLREIQEKQKLNEKKEGFDQMQKEFLAKERRKQEVLKKRFLASKFKSGSDLEKEKKRYDDFVALKAQQAKKLTKGDPNAALRKRFSEKANEFIEFAEIRQRLRKKLTTGAEEKVYKPNQTAEDYRNFVEGHQESREKAKLVEGDPNSFLKERYSKKAKEFQEFITQYKRANDKQRLANTSETAKTAFSRQQSKKAKEFQEFITQHKRANDKQRLANTSETAKTAFSRQQSKKAKEFQEFITQYKRANDDQKNANASETAKTAFSRQQSKKAKEFQEFITQYNRANAEQKNINASGTAKTALSRQESKKAKEFQEFITQYNRANAEQKISNASGTAKTSLSRQESAKAKEFQEFITQYNRANAEQKITNASGTAKTALSRQESAKAKEFQEFITQYNRANAEQKITNASGTAKTSLSRQESAKAKEFQKFITQYDGANAEQKIINASGTSEGIVSKRVRENRAKYTNFVDTKQKQKIAVLGYSGISKEEAYKQFNQSKANEFEEFVKEKRAQSALKEGDGQTGNAINRGDFRKKAFREFIAQQQARHAKAPLESGFQRPPPQVSAVGQEASASPVQPAQQTVPMVPLTPKHAQIRSSGFDNFLMRAQKNQDRATRN